MVFWSRLKDDVLEIEDFHRNLKNVEKVYLAGAFAGQCVFYVD